MNAKRKDTGPTIQGYSNFVTSDISGKALEFLPVKLADNVESGDASHRRLKEITSHEFLSRILERKGVLATPENVAALLESMPQWQCRSFLIDDNPNMNTAQNRFVFIDVPDVKPAVAFEHTIPALVGDHRTTLSISTLAGFKTLSKDSEAKAFAQPSTGPLVSIRGRVAPGLREQKQERWKDVLDQTELKAERLGQNEATLEDVFLQHLFPFREVEELKVPIRTYQPPRHRADVMEKHAALGTAKKLTHSPNPEANPSMSARRYFFGEGVGTIMGEVEALGSSGIDPLSSPSSPLGGIARGLDRFSVAQHGGFGRVGGGGAAPSDSHARPRALFGSDTGSPISLGARGDDHSPSGPWPPREPTDDQQQRASPRLAPVRPRGSTQAADHHEPPSPSNDHQSASPLGGADPSSRSRDPAVDLPSTSQAAELDSESQAQSPAARAPIKHGISFAAGTRMSHDGQALQRSQFGSVSAASGESHVASSTGQQAGQTGRRDSINSVTSRHGGGPQGSRRRSILEAQQAEMDALSVVTTAAEDDVDGTSRILRSLPVSSLRELAQDVKVKHSSCVQYMSAFVQDLKDWQTTLSLKVRRSDLTEARIDLSAKELMTEHCYSLMMNLVQYLYMEFMYRICERAAAELGKQFTASSLSSRKLMGFDGVTTAVPSLLSRHMPAPSPPSPLGRPTLTRSTSSRPIMKVDGEVFAGYKIPMSTKVLGGPAPEDSFDHREGAQSLLYKILMEFGPLCSGFRNHKALGKYGTFFLLPMWLVSMRGFVDSVFTRTFPSYTKYPVGKQMLLDMQERLTSLFDPHGYLGETPILRSHPVAVRIARTMGWKVHRATWPHFFDTSPLVRAAIDRPHGSVGRAIKRKEQQAAEEVARTAAASRAASPRTLMSRTGQAAGASPPRPGLQGLVAPRGGAGLVSRSRKVFDEEEEEEEESSGADALESEATDEGGDRGNWTYAPPASPRRRIHPAKLEALSRNVQRVHNSTHRKDLVNLAWASALVAKRRGKEDLSFVRALIPRERDQWLRTNIDSGM